MRRWAAAGLLALAATAPAAAHVIPQPAYLTSGVETTITFAAPNERPPHAMTSLTLTAPEGIAVTRVSPPPGWWLSIAGRTATWRRGAAAKAAGPFRIAATTSSAPGTVTFHAAQRYDDGGVVRWPVALTILPGATTTPRQHFLPAFVAAILGLVLIGFLLFRMRDRHGRDLQGE
jgi:uncharacterized protein YcnI